MLDESIYTAVPTLLACGRKSSGKATVLIAFPVGTAALCQKVIITTLLIRTAWPLVMPYADRSSSPQAILVLNTLRKMYKTEFCLNNHTNGRNTNLNGDVLWTNPAPQSAFVAQTLADIDISDYLSFEIVYSASVENPGRALYSKITRDTYDPSAGNMDWIQHPSNRPAVLVCRSAYIADGKISFGNTSVRNSTDSSGSVSNGWIIPLSVRGYKHY